MSELVTEGFYAATIQAHYLGKAKTGTPQFVIVFTLDDLGIKRSCYLHLTEKTIERVAATLDFLGYTLTKFGPLDPSHPEHFSLHGRKIQVCCSIQQSADKGAREQWNIVIPTTRKANTVTDYELQPFELRMEQLRASRVRDKSNAEISDEDIPF